MLSTRFVVLALIKEKLQKMEPDTEHIFMFL